MKIHQIMLSIWFHIRKYLKNVHIIKPSDFVPCLIVLSAIMSQAIMSSCHCVRRYTVRRQCGSPDFVRTLLFDSQNLISRKIWVAEFTDYMYHSMEIAAILSHLFDEKFVKAAKLLKKLLKR